MQKLLLILCLLVTQTLLAQRGWIYIKKNGFKKVRSFNEGSSLKFKTKQERIVTGTLIFVKKDSIYVNADAFALSDITTIYVRDRKKSKASMQTFLYTTAGVALTTTGIVLAKWDSFQRGLIYSAIIGYGNFLIKHFPSFKRKKYQMGKKFTLQAIDLHF